MLATLRADRGISVGRAARAAVRLDPAKLQFGLAVRCALGIALVLGTLTALGRPHDAIAAAVGALSTGLASQQGLYRTRARAMLLNALGMAGCAFAAGLAAPHAAASIGVAALFGYVYGVGSSLGAVAVTVLMYSGLSLFVFMDPEFARGSVGVDAFFVFTGGVVQMLLAVAVWPARRFTVERTALAAAYRGLAAYARSSADGSLALPATAAIAAARAALRDPQPFARPGALPTFRTLLDLAERMRGTLAACTAEARASHACETLAQEIAEAERASATVLRAVADGLAAARAPRDEAAAWSRLDGLERTLAAHDAADCGAALAAVRALLGQLRAAQRAAAFPADRPAEAPRGKRRPILAALSAGLRDAVATVRANLAPRSAFGAHGIRLAGAVGAAMLLYRGCGVPHGNWIPLTVLLVLRVDFTSTFERGFARVGGTALGCVAATLLATLHPPAIGIDAALAVVFAFTCFLTITASYALYSGSVTAFVVLTIAMLGRPDLATVLERLTATALGGGIAFAAYLVRPSWEGPRVRERLASLVAAHRRYAALLLAAYRAPVVAEPAEIGAAQSAAWVARTEAELSVARMLAEPGTTHAIDRDRASGLLAEGQRIALALLSLRDGLAQRTEPAPASLDALAGALDAEFATSLEALRTARGRAEPSPRPRAAYYALADDGGSRTIAGETLVRRVDLLVNGVDTYAAILARVGPHVSRA